MRKIKKIHECIEYAPDNYFAEEGGNDGYDYGIYATCVEVAEYENGKMEVLEGDYETNEMTWFTTTEERDKELKEMIKDAILFYEKITFNGEQLTDYMQSGGCVPL